LPFDLKILLGLPQFDLEITDEAVTGVFHGTTAGGDRKGRR
jgi:hypothetical protein